MKTYSTACQAELDAGTARRAGALKVDSSPTPFRYWGGNGQATLGGEVYDGLGANLMAAVFAGQLGSTETGGTVTLSGVDPDVLAGVDLTAARGCDCVVWELIFDASGRTLLHSEPALLGTADQLQMQDQPGGTSALVLTVLGASAALGKKSGRMATDADQRLIKATDGSLSRISYAGMITLYWGGQRPSQASAALPGVAGALGAGGVLGRLGRNGPLA